MTAPKLLDLYCGAGGASMGYHLAGFQVAGVDLSAQPRYPFWDVIQGDALTVLADVSFCRGFDVLHASPPCQAYSTLRSRHGHKRYADLVEATRAALVEVGRPYVIENVVGAPLLDPLMLCGSMFGLGVGALTLKRHRLFESSVELVAPGPDACSGKAIVGVYGNGGGWTRTVPGGGGVKAAGQAAATALGIDWTRHQPALAQAIPPAYTRHIGAQLLAVVDA